MLRTTPLNPEIVLTPERDNPFFVSPPLGRESLHSFITYDDDAELKRVRGFDPQIGKRQEQSI